MSESADVYFTSKSRSVLMCVCVCAVACGERAGEAALSSSSVLPEEPAAAEREEPGDRPTDHDRPPEPTAAARPETGDLHTLVSDLYNFNQI